MRSSDPRPWLKISALGLATATVLLALSASAVAASPEIGRCVKLTGVKEGKKTVYNGAYINSKCTKLSAVKSRKFEWMPGIGPHPGFTGTGSSSFIIEDGGGQAPVTRCGGESLEGEFTSVTSLTEHVVFGGCSWAQYACVEAGECPQPCPELPEGAPNERECEVFYPCTSEGAEVGEVRAPLPLNGEVVLTAGGRRPKAALGLGGGGIEYRCDLMEMTSLGGFSSGELAPLNKMTSELRLSFGPKHQPATSGLKDVYTLEEPVEVRAVE